MNGVLAEEVKRVWPLSTPEVRRPDLARGRAGVLAALFLVGWATFLNLYATQPLLPQFRQVFRASELMVSLTVSAPVLAVALAGPLLGMLADSVGRKRVIVATMLALAVPTALASTAGTLWQLIGWRFLQGLLTPGIVAVAMAYVSEETPDRSVGATMATYVTGGVVGGFSGRFASGLLAANWGWRWAMLALAVATFAGGLLTWWLLPRSRNFTRHGDLRAGLRSLTGHLANRQLLATYWVGFNVLFCLVGAFTYVNFYLADSPFHLGPAALASIFGVYLVGAAVTPISGRVLDRVGSRRVIIGAAMIAGTGMILTLLHVTPVVVVGLAIAASGAFASQSAASIYVGKMAGNSKSSASGLYLGFYYLGGCCGSVLPGLLWKHAGWSGCVGIILCFQVATALIAGRTWRE